MSNFHMVVRHESGTITTHKCETRAEMRAAIVKMAEDGDEILAAYEGKELAIRIESRRVYDVAIDDTYID